MAAPWFYIIWLELSLPQISGLKDLPYLWDSRQDPDSPIFGCRSTGVHVIQGWTHSMLIVFYSIAQLTWELQPNCKENIKTKPLSFSLWPCLIKIKNLKKIVKKWIGFISIDNQSAIDISPMISIIFSQLLNFWYKKTFKCFVDSFVAQMYLLTSSKTILMISSIKAQLSQW